MHQVLNPHREKADGDMLTIVMSVSQRDKKAKAEEDKKTKIAELAEEKRLTDQKIIQAQAEKLR